MEVSAGLVSGGLYARTRRCSGSAGPSWLTVPDTAVTTRVGQRLNLSNR